jgi:hypothetical protein
MEIDPVNVTGDAAKVEGRKQRMVNFSGLGNTEEHLLAQ